MRNIVAAFIAALSLTLCCGGPLVMGSLGFASLGWFLTGKGLALLVAMSGVIGAIIWTRKRHKDDCDCKKE
jgi:hypothetical protein